ncbi:DUF6117 family protein, partial [Acinetobacter baumannii]
LDASSEETRSVLCAVGRDKGDYVFTPFGHLADGNPYEAYLPPGPDNAGGFLSASTAGTNRPSPATDDKGGGHGDTQ